MSNGHCSLDTYGANDSAILNPFYASRDWRQGDLSYVAKYMKSFGKPSGVAEQKSRWYR